MKKDSLILFFHGYGSSVNTDKFTGIVFTNKVAVPIDYDLGLKNALNIAADICIFTNHNIIVEEL